MESLKFACSWAQELWNHSNLLATDGMAALRWRPAGVWWPSAGEDHATETEPNTYEMNTNGPKIAGLIQICLQLGSKAMEPFKFAYKWAIELWNYLNLHTARPQSYGIS